MLWPTKLAVFGEGVVAFQKEVAMGEMERKAVRSEGAIFA
jgi:hypothetical protein